MTNGQIPHFTKTLNYNALLLSFSARVFGRASVFNVTAVVFRTQGCIIKACGKGARGKEGHKKGGSQKIS